MSTNGPQWDWGDRLRKIRRTIAATSQAGMADIVGVKTATYSAWEGGRNEPSLKVAYAVAQRLEAAFPGKVTAGWVLGIDSAAGVEALLPRMDSNHQPPDCRLDAGSSPGQTVDQQLSPHRQSRIA